MLMPSNLNSDFRKSRLFAVIMVEAFPATANSKTWLSPSSFRFGLQRKYIGTQRHDAKNASYNMLRSLREMKRVSNKESREHTSSNSANSALPIKGVNVL
jgi:hypothetical protein